MTAVNDTALEEVETEIVLMVLLWAGSPVGQGVAGPPLPSFPPGGQER